MTSPNLQGMIVHAAGRVAAGGALTNGINIASVVRNGVGDYTVNLASEIDATQRYIHITPTATDLVHDHVIANDTDASFDVGCDANNFPGVPADGGFYFMVFRTVRPG